jgi:hypothetical protein
LAWFVFTGLIYKEEVESENENEVEFEMEVEVYSL